MNESQLIPNIIATVISEFPIIMTVLALLIGVTKSFRHKDRPYSAIYLNQLMFWAVGLSGIWGFVLHAFFPEMSAKFIGWQTSPFQYEVAVANLGMGIMGIFGFRASKGYQIATTIFTTCFLWGAASGHIIQMINANNFAPGNAGAIFYNDVFLPILLIIFVRKT